MEKYLKLKCIDCHYEQVVEVPKDGFLKCPKCGKTAVSPSPKSKMVLKVESVIQLYGKQILEDIPRFCDLVIDALVQDNYFLYTHEQQNFEELRNAPEEGKRFLAATQESYLNNTFVYKNPLTEAIYEALGIETITKRERGIAYVPPAPVMPRVVFADDSLLAPKPEQKQKSHPKAKPTPPPPPPPASVAPRGNTSEHKRFVLPSKITSAEVHCEVHASSIGWEKGQYKVCFRTGYPCAAGENPKDAILEIARWNGHCYVAQKEGHLDTVRGIFIAHNGFWESSLLIEFSDGKEGFLVTVKRSERKELDKMQEIARHNRRT